MNKRKFKVYPESLRLIVILDDGTKSFLDIPKSVFDADKVNIVAKDAITEIIGDNKIMTEIDTYHFITDGVLQGESDRIYVDLQNYSIPHIKGDSLLSDVFVSKEVMKICDTIAEELTKEFYKEINEDEKSKI